jgi:O-antigen/teichoic acid export membrane protein
VRRGILSNLAGSIVPLLLAVWTVPIYLNLIGIERYGVMTIVWLLLGYFSVFDLGLARATSNLIAKLDAAKLRERQEVFFSAVWLNTFLGVGGAVVLAVIGSPLIVHFFKMSSTLQIELLAALPWIAIAVPVVLLGGVTSGVLEAMERFATLNILQAGGNVLFLTTPLVAAMLTEPRLDILIPVAVLARALSGSAIFIAATRALSLKRIEGIKLAHSKTLLRYGAWISVTNVIGPLLETLDRLVIASVLGAKAVAYYSVPFTLIEKMRIVPGAVSRTLFPRLSGLNRTDANAVASHAEKLIALLMTTLVAPVLFLIEPVLKIWLGTDFGNEAAPIAKLILLGVWSNSLAHIPLVLLQSQGRPDVCARFHVMEFLPFILVLWVGLQYFGVVGAAFAWTARVTADCVLLLHASRVGRGLLPTLLPSAIIVLIAYAISTSFSLGSLTSFLVAMLTAAALVFWMLFTEREIRSILVDVKRKIIGT